MAFCQNTCQYTCQSVSESEGLDMVEWATCVTRSICSRQHRDLISDSKERTASGSQWGMGSQSEFHQPKRKVWLDVMNVCHRFFLPVGLLLKPVEHVQHQCTPPIHCACIESVFRSPVNRKKSKDRKGRPWNELCPICPYWSCFRRFIVLRCSHLSLC